MKPFLILCKHLKNSFVSGDLFMGVEVALWIGLLSSLQLSSLSVQWKHQCLGAGRPQHALVGCNWNVLKLLRSCTAPLTMQRMESAPTASHQCLLWWKQLRALGSANKPHLWPESVREGAELQRATGFQMLPLTVLGILTHLEQHKEQEICVQGCQGPAFPLTALRETCQQTSPPRGENCLPSFPGPLQGLINRSLKQPRTGTVIRTILHHFLWYHKSNTQQSHYL